MDSTQLTPLQVQVLHVLAEHGGTTRVMHVVETFQARSPRAEYQHLIDALDAALSTLWKHGYIGIPGLRWLSTTPDDIRGFLGGGTFLQQYVVLNRKGRARL